MRAFRVKLAVTVAVLGAAGVGTAAVAGDHRGGLRTHLSGWEEVPVVSTEGNGTFRARIAGNQIAYELSYGDLNGAVLQAHIHLGQRDVNGGISAFLCTNIGNAPASDTDVPACPQEGTVTGTIDADDVIGPVQQGIAPGEFAELVRAMRAGFTYANVHTEPHQGGEIRGQIGGKRRHR